MIWYVTSESENTEGLDHLLHNKLCRGSQSCCACFVVSDLDDTGQCGLWLGWTSERFWPLYLQVSQKWWEGASVAGDVFFQLVCSAVCSHSRRVAQLSHILGGVWPKEPLHVTDFPGVFLCPCSSHSHTQCMRDRILHWWGKGSWIFHSSALLARLWRCGAGGWVCSVPLGVH